MIRQNLIDLGIEEKEKVDAIMKLYGEGINSLREQIAKHEATITELNEQIKSTAGSAKEIEELKGKVADYEQAEKTRKEAEAKAEKEKKLMANITEAIGDAQFVNTLTKDGVINQIKEALLSGENAGKGAKEIFEEITKDAENIFANPQQNVVIKKAGSTDQSNIKSQMDELYKNNPFYKG